MSNKIKTENIEPDVKTEIKEEGVKQEPESDNLPPLIENDVKSEVESDLQLVNVNSLGTKTESTQSKTIYDKYAISFCELTRV